MTERIRAVHIGIGPAAEESLVNGQGDEWDFQGAGSWWQCLKQLADKEHDVLVTGTDLDGISVDRLIEEALRLHPTLTVVVLSQQPDYSRGRSISSPWRRRLFARYTRDSLLGGRNRRRNHARP